MADYLSYSCSDLLNYLNKTRAKGKRSDKINYSEYLLTMESAKSIRQLIIIYDKVLYQYLTSLYLSQDKIPDTWPDLEKTDALLKQLNGYYNEQIERLFHLQPYSDMLALESLINLRNAPNYNDIVKRISSHCSEDVNAKLGEIYDMSKIVQCSNRSLDADSSKVRKSLYKKNISIFLHLGYKRSFRDITICNKIGLFAPDSFFFYSLLIFIIGLISLIIVVSNDSINDFAKTYIYIPISIGIILWGAINIMMNYNGNYTEENKFNIKQEIIVLLCSLLGGFLLFMLISITAELSIFGIILLIGLPGALLSYLK